MGCILTHVTQIAGIPCQVRYTPIPGYKGFRARGEQYPLEPDEPDGVEILEVLDRRGYKASWLASKMTDKDALRIQEEIIHSEW